MTTKQNTITNESLFWLCFVSFLVGMAIMCIIYNENILNVQTTNGYIKISSCNSSIQNNSSLNNSAYGKLEIGILPIEPKSWGIICSRNYTTKINETFIGCVKTK